MLKPAVLALALAAVTTSAFAQDAATASADPDPVATLETEAQKTARANAEWARKVMAGEPTGEDSDDKAKGCVRNPDRKPHGMVWGEVGTGGYKSGGAIVTQPIGDCGSLTVGYEQTHDNRSAHIHRRK